MARPSPAPRPRGAPRGKTVRFTRVVERSGEPHVHTLWVAPEKDPELKRALATNRVLSLEPTGAGRQTDIGQVGFDPKHQPTQLLIFPKSLKPFAGARIVGIKFDLIEQPRIVSATGDDDKARTRARKARHSKAALSKHRHVPPKPSEPPPSEPSESSAADSPAKKETTQPRSRVASRAAPPPHDRLGSSRSAQAAPPPALLREVRAAIKELERGKVVAAHHRLERAVADAANA